MKKFSILMVVALIMASCASAPADKSAEEQQLRQRSAEKQRDLDRASEGR